MLKEVLAMAWQEELSPAARERLQRLGGLSEQEREIAADESALEESLRLFYKDDMTEDELLVRLKEYESRGKWSILRSARASLQSSFKATGLRIQFSEEKDGSLKVKKGEPPAPQAPASVTAADGAVLEVTDATFDAAVREHPLIVVDCWAVWCGPCRMVAPVIEELARDYAGRITFAKLDVDQNRATAARFNVQSIPTMLIFKNGTLVDQKMGAMPKAMLEPIVKKHLDTGGGARTQ
jgi:thioredoxin 1